MFDSIKEMNYYNKFLANGKTTIKNNFKMNFLYQLFLRSKYLSIICVAKVYCMVLTAGGKKKKGW